MNPGKTTLKDRYYNPATNKIDPYISINKDIYDLPGTNVKPLTPKPTDTGTDKNKTGGGSGGSKTTTTTNGGNDLSSYLDSLYNQKLSAAQNAYNQGMARLNDAYNNAAGNYGNIYNRGVSNLKSSYNNSLGKINSNAQDAMQEAYINKMLSMKNLSQALSAQGLSGGASESATAGLINNYGNSRNGIQKTWDTNRGDLEQTYNTNLGNLYSAYQQQMASLDQNRANAMNALESNLANSIADYSNSFLSTIMANPQLLNNAVSTAQNNQAAFTPEEAAATNAVNSINTQQNNDMGSVTQAARARALEEQMAQQPTSYRENLIRNLINQGYNKGNITEVLNQLYY